MVAAWLRYNDLKICMEGEKTQIMNFSDLQGNGYEQALIFRQAEFSAVIGRRGRIGPRILFHTVYNFKVFFKKNNTKKNSAIGS